MNSASASACLDCASGLFARIPVLQGLYYAPGQFGADARGSGQLGFGGRSDAAEAAEMAQKLLLPLGADAGHGIQRGRQLGLVAQMTVTGDAEAVGLVAYAHEIEQRRCVGG